MANSEDSSPMPGSKASTPAHPLRTFLFGLLLFLAIDTAIFRSGLYARIQSPESIVGKFYYTILYEHRRPADPVHDVLVLGNSKMEWGFSVKDHERIDPADPLHYINGATSASLMEWWYYQLRAVDPHHDRYRAIVIPVNGYTARPDHDILMETDGPLAVTPVLLPVLSWHDWPHYLAGFPNLPARLDALKILLFPSKAYRNDVTDLVLRPVWRWDKWHERQKSGAYRLYDDNGLGTANLADLRYNFASGRVSHWPTQFSQTQDYNSLASRILTLHHMEHPRDPQGSTLRGLTYNAGWLNAIVDMYRGSQTQIIVAPIPAYGVPMAGSVPLPGAPDLRQRLKAAPNLILLDDQPFRALVKPEFFYDTLHINSGGELLLTQLITTDVSAALSKNMPISCNQCEPQHHR